MGDLKKKLQIAEEKIVSAENRLSAAERYGSWCASRSRWTSPGAVITYNYFIHEDSNMNSNALNRRTGKID